MSSSSAAEFPGSLLPFELQRRGATVEVVDSGERAGGVIGTMHRDGAL